MLSETYFKMSNLPTPSSSGTAPIFIKSVNYNKRKDEFTPNRTSFDSYKNFFLFYLFIFFFKDECINNLYHYSYGTDPFPLKTETTSNIVTSTTTSNTTDNSMVESNMIPNNDISAVEDKSNLTDNPADLSEDIYYTLNNSSTDILNNDTNDDSSSDNYINRDDNSEADSVMNENKED